MAAELLSDLKALGGGHYLPLRGVKDSVGGVTEFFRFHGRGYTFLKFPWEGLYFLSLYKCI